MTGTGDSGEAEVLPRPAITLSLIATTVTGTWKAQYMVWDAIHGMFSPVCNSFSESRIWNLESGISPLPWGGQAYLKLNLAFHVDL